MVRKRFLLSTCHSIFLQAMQQLCCYQTLLYRGTVKGETFHGKTGKSIGGAGKGRECGCLRAAICQYAQDLYRFAYYYLGSREEAEDAVQDAVCAASRGLAPAQCLILQGLAFFHPFQHLQAPHCGGQREAAYHPLEEARRLGESECSEELMLAMELREAIYALSDEERSIVLLSIIGGYKSHEIAKALSCPPGTVRSKLSRSLAKLRLTAEKESS